MENDEQGQLLRALEEWAFSHPKKDRAFLILMGRSYTPLEYFRELMENKEFRSELFQFLSEQAERAHQRPIDMINRAIEANRL
jgi:hypothetical protein